jgi:hypothetical protein
MKCSCIEIFFLVFYRIFYVRPITCMVTTRLPVESELRANEGEEKVIIKIYLAVVQNDEHSSRFLITFTLLICAWLLSNIKIHLGQT